MDFSRSEKCQLYLWSKVDKALVEAAGPATANHVEAGVSRVGPAIEGMVEGIIRRQGPDLILCTLH